MKESTNKKPTIYPPVYLTIWQEAWTAITKPSFYKQWVNQPFKRSIQYLSILNIVLALVSTAYFFITIRPAILNAQSFIADNFPQSTIENGQLSIEGDDVYTLTDSNQVFFKVDASEQLQDNMTLDKFYQTGVLVLRDGVLIGGSGDYTAYTYSEAGLDSLVLNASIVNEWIDSFLYIITPILPLLIFGYLMIARLLFTLFVSGIFYLFSRKDLSLTQVWTLAIYALTPAIVASYISFVFYPLPGVFTLIFVSYLTLALLNIQLTKSIKN